MTVKPFIIFVSAICLSILFSLAFVPNASADQPIVLSTSFGMPYVSEGDKDGFLTLLAEDIFKRIGLEVQIEILPAERSIMNANNGIEDGELNRVSGLEKIYPNLIMVPEPFISVDFVGFTKPRNHIPLANRNRSTPDVSWRSLEPYIVGIIRGWKIYEKNVTGVAKRIDVRNINLLLTLLKNNRVDIVMATRVTGLYNSHKNDIAVSVIEPPFVTRNNYMYLNKRHAHLVPKLAAALAEAKKDGTYDRLYNRILRPLIN